MSSKLLSVLTVFIIVSVAYTRPNQKHGIFFDEDNNPSYVFPTRYIAGTIGWVSDELVNHQKAYILGWIYTDYSINTQLIEEVFNKNTTYGSEFYNLGIRSDSHLFYPDIGYYYYSNYTGSYCEKSPSGLFGQYQFDSSTYIGIAIKDGISCYQFSSCFPPPLAKTCIDFYVSTATERPVSMVVPNILKYFDGSVVNYITFEEVESFEEDFFDVPPFCPTQ
eukprot:TRINITY_DN12825_c0_g1_i1.p1 TRINITY_DN12825_c0_g1~~TRINITY_DN12825_c0_g1_i1.p1  ORF type:complete len:221 (+),score=65.27 TRINITY_DN12825_c0_g1_i1:45-707(+)